MTLFFEHLLRFREEEDATLSVELVLILPLLIWGFLTVYTIFDVFRVRNLSLKANYAVSDLLTRETNSIDATYLNGVRDIYKYLTQSGDGTWLRVTQVFCNDDCEDLENREIRLDWSRATDSQSTYSTTTMREQLEPQIPLLAEGSRAIIVETSMDYVPPFLPPTIIIPGANDEWGWGVMRHNIFRDTVVTEPRFGPQLCWSGVNGC